MALCVALACGGAFTLDRVAAAPGHYPFMIFVGLTGMFMLIAAAWRRLHDRGRRGTWLLLLLLGPGALAGASVMVYRLAATRHADISEVTNETIVPLVSVVIGVTLLINFVAGLWVLVELMRPGEPGANRFGSSPSDTR